MSAKHTPGPWLFEKDGRITSANGWMLASAHPTKRAPDAQSEREPGESWIDAYERLEPERNEIKAQTEANARLIAAAPELLEALNESIEREYNPFEPDNQSNRYKRLCALRHAATGGQQ